MRFRILRSNHIDGHRNACVCSQQTIKSIYTSSWYKSELLLHMWSFIVIAKILVGPFFPRAFAKLMKWKWDIFIYMCMQHKCTYIYAFTRFVLRSPLDHKMIFCQKTTTRCECKCKSSKSETVPNILRWKNRQIFYNRKNWFSVQWHFECRRNAKKWQSYTKYSTVHTKRKRSGEREWDKLWIFSNWFELYAGILGKLISIIRFLNFIHVECLLITILRKFWSRHFERRIFRNGQ